MDSLEGLVEAARTIAAGEKIAAEGKAVRNKLIVEARIDGWPWQAIADAVSLTPVGVQKIARKLNGGKLPVPRQRK